MCQVCAKDPQGVHKAIANVNIAKSQQKHHPILSQLISIPDTLAMSAMSVSEFRAPPKFHAHLTSKYEIPSGKLT